METPDTHIEGILRARINKKKTLGFVAPETIGQRTSLLFGPSALGGESIVLKGKEMGVSLKPEQVDAVVEAMRNRLQAVDALSEGEVEQIILRLSRPGA